MIFQVVYHGCSTIASVILHTTTSVLMWELVTTVARFINGWSVPLAQTDFLAQKVLFPQGVYLSLSLPTATVPESSTM